MEPVVKRKTFLKKKISEICFEEDFLFEKDFCKNYQRLSCDVQGIISSFIFGVRLEFGERIIYASTEDCILEDVEIRAVSAYYVSLKRIGANVSQSTSFLHVPRNIASKNLVGSRELISLVLQKIFKDRQLTLDHFSLSLLPTRDLYKLYFHHRLQAPAFKGLNKSQRRSHLIGALIALQECGQPMGLLARLKLPNTEELCRILFLYSFQEKHPVRTQVMRLLERFGGEYLQLQKKETGDFKKEFKEEHQKCLEAFKIAYRKAKKDDKALAMFLSKHRVEFSSRGALCDCQTCYPIMPFVPTEKLYVGIPDAVDISEYKQSLLDFCNSLEIPIIIKKGKNKKRPHGFLFEVPASDGRLC